MRHRRLRTRSRYLNRTLLVQVSRCFRYFIVDCKNRIIRTRGEKFQTDSKKNEKPSMEKNTNEHLKNITRISRRCSLPTHRRQNTHYPLPGMWQARTDRKSLHHPPSPYSHPAHTPPGRNCQPRAPARFLCEKSLGWGEFPWP